MAQSTDRKRTLLRCFLRAECGAATTDYVVLLAGLAALALATVLVISGSVENMAADTARGIEAVGEALK